MNLLSRALFSSIACIVALAASTFAQTPGPAPVRDPQAVAVVQQAITALGGAQAISATGICSATGSSNQSPKGWMQTGTFIWKNSGHEFRYEMTTQGGTSVYVSGQGHPSIATSSGARKLFRHSSEASFPLHLPGWVLWDELRNRDIEITLLNPLSTGGTPRLGVRTRITRDTVEADLTEQRWYFDANSGLPVEVIYNMPNDWDAGRLTQLTAGLSSYGLESGVLIPHQISIQADGLPGGTAVIQTIFFPSSLSSSEFENPTGGR